MRWHAGMWSSRTLVGGDLGKLVISSCNTVMAAVGHLFVAVVRSVARVDACAGRAVVVQGRP